MRSTWTEVERNAYDITAGDEGELRQNKHYNGDHVTSEFARGLEAERDAALKRVEELEREIQAIYEDQAGESI